ncbi:MAG: AraC family transcriptional regulator [Vicinamibacteria bacterium]
MAQPATTLDYGERLDRVLAYLAENLDRAFDLDRLADVACFSPFHFHRIFHALLGETVAESVRRMRLHRAALELIEGETPVARIASRAGYGSQAAFTRAFRSAYGAPPAAYRASVPEWLPGDAVTVRADPAVELVGLRLEGDYERIGATFERLNALATARGWVGPATRFFGIYYQDPAGTAEADLRSDACLTAPPGFAGEGGLRPLTLAGGRHAVLLHVGPYAELHRAYTWLYREWLPRSGEVPADRPCVEEYLNNPRQVPPLELRTEIWLPLLDAGGTVPPACGRT